MIEVDGDTPVVPENSPEQNLENNLGGSEPTSEIQEQSEQFAVAVEDAGPANKVLHVTKGEASFTISLGLDERRLSVWGDEVPVIAFEPTRVSNNPEKTVTDFIVRESAIDLEQYQNLFSELCALARDAAQDDTITDLYVRIADHVARAIETVKESRSTSYQNKELEDAAHPIPWIVNSPLDQVSFESVRDQLSPDSQEIHFWLIVNEEDRVVAVVNMFSMADDYDYDDKRVDYDLKTFAKDVEVASLSQRSPITVHEVVSSSDKIEDVFGETDIQHELQPSELPLPPGKIYLDYENK